MGDQVGTSVKGTLYYVPLSEFKRIKTLSISDVKKTELFASFCRINTLYMIAQAGSGHIGSSFSSIDIMSWLQMNVVNEAKDVESLIPENFFFSSKGHDAPALYSTLIGLEKIDFDLLHKLRRINGLPGHPDIGTPHIFTNTGSLGMGVSKAKGMIFAKRLKNQPFSVYVLTGDGELQEGQFWESLISAANHNLFELTVIIDHNKLQSDTLVSKVSDLGDLESKLNAFGFHVERCNGNNLNELSSVFSKISQVKDKPKVIIADTIKGKGVSFMEHTSIDSDVEFYKFHSGAPSADAYQEAAMELINSSNLLLSSCNMEELKISVIDQPTSINSSIKPQKLIPSYSSALIEQAIQNDNVVALDADLVIDTGVIEFKSKFENRFLECGIAEQDMVSQAGGMAAMGLIPIVHSFACFLTSRANEQIYNNTTEKRKIIYVGSLAGVIPAGPGHSHQAVRDITSLSGNPGLTMIEPYSESEVRNTLNWAINENSGSTYIRLCSIPFSLPFSQPEKSVFEKGKGTVISDGLDIVIMTYGPVMLSQAYLAVQALKNQGISTKLINMPWLNTIDLHWLSDELTGIDTLLIIDNHYTNGGLGSYIAGMIYKNQSLNKLKVSRLGINEIPVCGSVDEVLEAHGLDSESIVNYVNKIINE
jgi:transketolase